MILLARLNCPHLSMTYHTIYFFSPTQAGPVDTPVPHISLHTLVGNAGTKTLRINSTSKNKI